MEEMAFNKGTVSKFDDSVVLVELDGEKTITQLDLEEEEHIIERLLGLTPYAAISIVPSNFKRFTPEAKTFLFGDNKLLKYRCLDCYIASSITQRIELELFFQFHKPKRKIRVFGSINKALTWINNHEALEDYKKELLC